MSEVPLPDALPGRYFVLEWKGGFINKSAVLGKRFVLTIDDASRSSYNLGSDIQVVMMRFRIWNLYDIGCRAIDIAKEFGACQVIPDQNRTVPVFDRNQALRRTLDFKQEDRTNAFNLPAFGR